MDTNLILGGLALAFGLFTLVARFVAPNSGIFSKLEPMKERWGATAGTVLHWTSYTILPLVFGSVMLAQALPLANG